MAGLISFINNNLPLDNPVITAICLGIVFMVIYDFYHLLFSAVLSWFKKEK